MGALSISSNHFQLATSLIHFDLSRFRRTFQLEHLATRPENFDVLRRLRRREHLRHGILGPIATAAMNFPSRAPFVFETEPDDGAKTKWIASCALDADAQSGAGLRVVKKHGRGAVLRHSKIDTAIAIVIRGRTAPLFAVDFDPAL